MDSINTFSMRNIIFVLILLASMSALASAQCCLSMDPTSQYCSSCPNGMHLFRDNCLIDIPHCLIYSNGFDC